MLSPSPGQKPQWWQRLHLVLFVLPWQWVLRMSSAHRRLTIRADRHRVTWLGTTGSRRGRHDLYPLGQCGNEHQSASWLARQAQHTSVNCVLCNSILCHLSQANLLLLSLPRSGPCSPSPMVLEPYRPESQAKYFDHLHLRG